MRENIERGFGLHASSRLLSALVEHGGMAREEAYGIVQRAARRAADERRPLRELVEADPAVVVALSNEQLADCFDETELLRHVDEMLARLDGLVERQGEAQHATR
jgi:adenylosuccinate lyase